MEPLRPGSNLILKSLLQRYKEGDGKAFEDFFNRTQRYVYNFIRLRIYNQADQEDLFQLTYLNVHRYILSYDESYNPITWISTICKNVILKHVQKRRLVVVSYDEASPSSQPFLTKDDSQHLKDLLADCFDFLKKEEIELISRRFLHDQDYEEIAAEQKTSTINIRKKISRVLDKIRTKEKPT